MFAEFLDLLKVLIRSPSVVGSEHSFFRVLQRELEERGAKVSWYEGVLVAQGDKPYSCLLSAHIDRHGLVCTGPNEFQYAAFVAGSRSDLLGNSVSEQLMNKIVDRFQHAPLTAYEPWSGVYRGAGTVENAYICDKRNNLIFELKGLEHLVAGTPIAFTDKLAIENQQLIGQLDNVLCAAMLVHLFSLGYQGTAFFTAQEEAGKSWRYLLEWFRRFGSRTNKLIVLDTSPFATQALADKQQLVLRKKDANAHFSADVTTWLAQICDNRGISYCYKDEVIDEQNRQHGEKTSIGSTEMGRIIAASAGMVTGTTLQIPTTGYHTMEETANIHACEAFLQVLQDLAGISV